MSNLFKKKRLSIIIACSIMLLSTCILLASCTNTNSCDPHIDLNGDGICDECEFALEISNIPNHDSENNSNNSTETDIVSESGLTSLKTLYDNFPTSYRLYDISINQAAEGDVSELFTEKIVNGSNTLTKYKQDDAAVYEYQIVDNGKLYALKFMDGTYQIQDVSDYTESEHLVFELNECYTYNEETKLYTMNNKYLYLMLEPICKELPEMFLYINYIYRFGIDVTVSPENLTAQTFKAEFNMLGHNVSGIIKVTPKDNGIKVTLELSTKTQQMISSIEYHNNKEMIMTLSMPNNNGVQEFYECHASFESGVFTVVNDDITTLIILDQRVKEKYEALSVDLFGNEQPIIYDEEFNVYIKINWYISINGKVYMDSWSFSYDEESNCLAKIDANGNVIYLKHNH